MRLYVGSDHGGVELRQALLAHAEQAGHEVLAVVGPASASDSVDYPDIAKQVCAKVLADPGSFGLLVCGTGQGVAMTANAIPGIRAGVVADVFSARMTRQHNDANVLCLGGRVLGIGLATDIFDAFAHAQFEGGRHARRVGKIDGEQP